MDSYDISGDRVRFAGAVFNRPDLVPVAKVIQYAEARDYPAVLAYCGSAEVARLLLRDIPVFIYADDLHVTRTGATKERVELGSLRSFRFDIEKKRGRWLVTAFSMKG